VSRLTLRQRRDARRVARECWMTAGGDIELAESLMRARPEFTSIDPQTLLLLLQIALQLWKWWKENNVSEPSVIPSVVEPGDWLDDD
jgi:hypothetical protein